MHANICVYENVCIFINTNNNILLIICHSEYIHRKKKELVFSGIILIFVVDFWRILFNSLLKSVTKDQYPLQKYCSSSNKHFVFTDEKQSHREFYQKCDRLIPI